MKKRKINRAPVVDPTENVIALSVASNIRQDDLRNSSDRFNLAQIENVKELAELRSIYEEKLTIAEAKRIDAIRSVDVNAVAIASEKAAAAAAVLANSVNSSAKNLEEQLKQYVGQINTRLSAVEKSQYEGQGKGSVTDPQLAALVDEVKKLNQANNQNQGRSAERKDYTSLVIAVGSLIIGAIAIIISITVK
jgi:hypothetical protein